MSKVLIISPDTIPIGKHLAAGPGIRSWEIARALKQYGHEITIAVPKDCYDAEINEASGVKIRTWDFNNLLKLCDDVDAVFLPQGKLDLSDFFVKHVREDICVIVDIYDPNLIEYLNLFTPDASGIKGFSDCLTAIVPILKRGDFFVCASNRQRYYYLGILNVLGRINPITYTEKLIDIVPFGVPDDDPVYENKKVMRGTLVNHDDWVVLWFGGIYPWFDAITLINAIDIAVKKYPKIKLIIMGAVHPRGYAPTDNYLKTLELSKQLGLYNKNVFFTEWKPYDERIYWYREADIGICTYPMHLETELSNRTRVVDMLWGNLPVVTTEGDEISRLIKLYKCGETVKPGDPEELARVLVDILDNDEKRKKMVENTKKLVDERLRCKKIVKPLAEFLNNPVIAKDRMNESASNTLLYNVDTLERHRDYIPTEKRLFEQEIKKRDQYANQLHQNIEQLNQHINKVNQYANQLNQNINQLKEDNQNKNEQIQSLEIKVHESNVRLNDIYSSLTWQLVMKFQKGMGILLPPGTRRRFYYNKVLLGLRTIASEGWGSFWNKLKKFLRSNESSEYNLWISKNEPDKEDLKNIREASKNFKYQPKISIITPVWNTNEKMLISMIESVLKQCYDNWELCIADGGSTKPHVNKILNKYIENDARIKVKFLPQNKGIAGNSNEALSLATGEFISFLDHDDEISPFALYEIVRLLNEHLDANLIYSDEDRLNEKGNRINPFFKPDWSLPMFLSTNYICHFLVYRNSLIHEVSGFREGFDGSQDYDTALRAIEKIPEESIYHIPKVLYHWRITPLSAASGRDAKPYAYEAGKKALEECLLRNRINGEVIELNDPGSYRVKKKIENGHSVDLIIVPDGHDESNNTDSIQNKLVEIISRTKCKPNKIYLPFASNMPEAEEYSQLSNEKLNEIVTNGNPDYIIFMEPDSILQETFIKPPSDWIEALIEHFSYFEVGIVGTGTFIFGNIVHNVRMPCGRIFGLKKDLLRSYLERNTVPSDFDDLQIALADHAISLGHYNLFTPHSAGNQFDMKKINKYYAYFEKNPSLTDNLMYYLPKI
ncbi:Glycosyl transferase family 2 [uncultured archaeon]|nr:Glycosyl transferase family 2 [uncultured archaeon]